jgi:hypothetical protein
MREEPASLAQLTQRFPLARGFPTYLRYAGMVIRVLVLRDVLSQS